MPAPRHVIFDLDGTLVDSLPGIAFSVSRALAASGRPAVSGHRLRTLIGPPIRDILAEVAGLASESAGLEALVAAFRRSYDSVGWRRTVPQPGAIEVLKRLDAHGAVLWLVTNKPRHATGMVLDRLEMARFFREVVCRDSRTPPYSSKAEMVVELVRGHGLDPAECLMAGDTEEDARAAAESGIEALLVPHGYGTVRPAPDGWRDLLLRFPAGPADRH